MLSESISYLLMLNTLLGNDHNNSAEINHTIAFLLPDIKWSGQKYMPLEQEKAIASKAKALTSVK